MKSVAVCIPTYRRPRYLHGLLQSLAATTLPPIDVHFVVVDNDEVGSARSVVSQFCSVLPNLKYAIEPSRGIAAARNRLVAIASELKVDCIAFVDDDEWVSAEWLTSLVDTMISTRAGAVAGPVIYRYESAVPEWMVDARLFEVDDRGRFPTGTPVRILGMGNQLLQRSWLEKLPGPFDASLSLTGGEDPVLWAQLFQMGLVMVWADEAVVFEWLPRSRASLKWLLMRHINYGIAGTRAREALDKSLASKLKLVVWNFGRIGVGLMLVLVSAVRGRGAMVRSALIVCRGIGGLAGTIGYAYHEYQRVHGN